MWVSHNYKFTLPGALARAPGKSLYCKGCSWKVRALFYGTHPVYYILLPTIKIVYLVRELWTIWSIVDKYGLKMLILNMLRIHRIRLAFHKIIQNWAKKSPNGKWWRTFVTTIGASTIINKQKTVYFGKDNSCFYFFLVLHFYIIIIYYNMAVIISMPSSVITLYMICWLEISHLLNTHYCFKLSYFTVLKIVSKFYYSNLIRHFWPINSSTCFLSNVWKDCKTYHYYLKELFLFKLKIDNYNCWARKSLKDKLPLEYFCINPTSKCNIDFGMLLPAHGQDKFQNNLPYIDTLTWNHL